MTIKPKQEIMIIMNRNKNDIYNNCIDTLFDGKVYSSVSEINDEIYKTMGDFFKDLEEYSEKDQKKYVEYWAEKAFKQFQIQGFQLFPLLLITSGSPKVNDRDIDFFKYVADYMLSVKETNKGIDEIVKRYILDDCSDEKGRFQDIIRSFRKELRKEYNKQHSKEVIMSRLSFIVCGLILGIILGFAVGYTLGTLGHHFDKESSFISTEFSEKDNSEESYDELSSKSESDQNSANSEKNNSKNENTSSVVSSKSESSKNHESSVESYNSRNSDSDESFDGESSDSYESSDESYDGESSDSDESHEELFGVPRFEPEYE